MLCTRYLLMVLTLTLPGRLKLLLDSLQTQQLITQPEPRNLFWILQATLTTPRRLVGVEEERLHRRRVVVT